MLLNGRGLNMKKTTWKKVYEDFKERYPSKRKEVIYWHPHDVATIMLYFKDGSKHLYNFDTKKINDSKETWVYKNRKEN